LWYNKLKRTVSIGNVAAFREIMLDIDDYEGFDYHQRWIKENEGNDILKVACLNGRTDLVKYLLENGWRDQINITNEIMQSAFAFALTNTVVNQRDEIRILEVLVENGADLLNDPQTQKSVCILKEKCTPVVKEYVEVIFNKHRRSKNIVAVILLTRHSIDNNQTILTKINKQYLLDVYSFL